MVNSFHKIYLYSLREFLGLMSLKKNLKLSAVRLRRLSEFSRWAFLAATGGEMRSD